MARATPFPVLVALCAVCALVLLAAPAAGAAGGGRPRAAAARPRPAAAHPARAARRPVAKARRPAAARTRRAARPERRCSPAGIRALHGTSRAERRVRCLINGQRLRAGLRPLRYDLCLDRAAERHGRDMVRRHYFAHSSIGGRSLAQRVQAAGYARHARSWLLGENLAWGAGNRASAHAAMRGWMHSPPHRRNILTAGFRDVGVAVVRGAPVSRNARPRPATFVVEFGARRPGRCSR